MTSSILVTGGTGSFGHQVVRHILDSTDHEIRIFSRDEAKQDRMRSELQDPRVSFFLGDVRDRDSLAKALKHVDFVFHAAALKQVPSAEFFPMEFVRTNVQGADNVIQASISAGVKKVVCLSTDKAVYPVNAMGMSKALMEKVALSYARSHIDSETRISITRYGNVLMSRGSVVPRFLKQIQEGIPLSVTNPEMTRFIMKLSESVDLVLAALESETTGDIFVRKSPACTIQDLADAVCVVSENPQYPKRIIGTRHAEKLYESLLSSEELSIAEESEQYFRVPLDERDLNYERYFDLGEPALAFSEGYNSHNASRLSISEVASLLRSLPDFVGIPD